MTVLIIVSPTSNSINSEGNLFHFSHLQIQSNWVITNSLGPTKFVRYRSLLKLKFVITEVRYNRVKLCNKMAIWD